MSTVEPKPLRHADPEPTAWPERHPPAPPQAGATAAWLLEVAGQLAAARTLGHAAQALALVADFIEQARQPHETVASAVSDLDDAAYSAWLRRTLAEGREAVAALAEE